MITDPVIYLQLLSQISNAHNYIFSFIFKFINKNICIGKNIYEKNIFFNIIITVIHAFF